MKIIDQSEKIELVKIFQGFLHRGAADFFESHHHARLIGTDKSILFDIIVSAFINELNYALYVISGNAPEIRETVNELMRSIWEVIAKLDRTMDIEDVYEH